MACDAAVVLAARREVPSEAGHVWDEEEGDVSDDEVDGPRRHEAQPQVEPSDERDPRRRRRELFDEPAALQLRLVPARHARDGGRRLLEVDGDAGPFVLVVLDERRDVDDVAVRREDDLVGPQGEGPLDGDAYVPAEPRDDVYDFGARHARHPLGEEVDFQERRDDREDVDVGGAVATKANVRVRPVGVRFERDGDAARRVRRPPPIHGADVQDERDELDLARLDGAVRLEHFRFERRRPAAAVAVRL
mmetsp:Transcript_11405/g.40171  ORF Transcript_11405/g.40171 Transcript_11405/m.40171 type:complete len:248 (-) Transcript_11405:308-1051(-)